MSYFELSPSPFEVGMVVSCSRSLPSAFVSNFKLSIYD